MKVKVSYPSGSVLHLSGEWKGPGNVDGNCIILIIVDAESALPKGCSPPMLKQGDAFVGDIRGVYQNEANGDVLYNPRNAMEGMNQWAVDWLKEHPEWPGVLELVERP